MKRKVYKTDNYKYKCMKNPKIRRPLMILLVPIMLPIYILWNGLKELPEVIYELRCVW